MPNTSFVNTSAPVQTDTPCQQQPSPSQHDEPLTQGELEEKVEQYIQEREDPFQKVEPPQPRPPCRCGGPHLTSCWTIQHPPPSNILDVQQDEPFPQGQLKEKVEEYAEERQTYLNHAFSEEKRPRPVITGDILLARPSFSGTPQLTFRDGSQPFFGLQQEPHPIRRAVDESKDYTGVKTFTVDGITFSVDFTRYKDFASFP